jgi:hypothetical protein
MTSFQAWPGATPRTGNPRIRASDGDRDMAVAQLREHFAAGRLSAAEGQDRISHALEARTLGELDELMTDLPGLGLGPDGRPGGAALPSWASATDRGSALRPSRAAIAAGPLAPPWQAGARLVIMITGIILAAYAVTGLLTGIWWIPWALIVVPAAHLFRRARPPELCAGGTGRAVTSADARRMAREGQHGGRLR